MSIPSCILPAARPTPINHSGPTDSALVLLAYDVGIEAWVVVKRLLADVHNV
jgi:hypothetical protein